MNEYFYGMSEQNINPIVGKINPDLKRDLDFHRRGMDFYIALGLLFLGYEWHLKRYYELSKSI